jgi:hypothetical protein
MASGNDETNAAAMGFAIIGVGMALMALMFFAVLAFLALILTIVAFCAWNNPLTLFGNTLYPSEARAFVGRGIAGAILVPVFVAFCQILFQVRMPWDDYLIYMLIGGYTLGSLGVEILMADEAEQAGGPGSNIQTIHPPVSPPPQAPRALPAPKNPEPFRYADWDDEEEFK